MAQETEGGATGEVTWKTMPVQGHSPPGVPAATHPGWRLGSAQGRAFTRPPLRAVASPPPPLRSGSCSEPFRGMVG